MLAGRRPRREEGLGRAQACSREEPQPYASERAERGAWGAGAGFRVEDVAATITLGAWPGRGRKFRIMRWNIVYVYM